MATPIAARTERDALLAAHRLNSWPTVMTPEKAACLARPAHVNVEATYQEGHFEAPNFEGLMLKAGELSAALQEGVRYRVEGLLLPGLPPGEICVGYGGPSLRPFVIEALTHGRRVEHPGVRVQAYRSLGFWERNGYGEHTEPRVSSFETLTGQKNGVVYVAVLRALGHPGHFGCIHHPCRRAWRGLFPGSGGSSHFWISDVFNPEPSPPPAELPSDPGEGVLALREHLLERIHQPPNQLGVDGVIMAFAQGTMRCLRMGEHRVLHRTSTSIDTLLWEHTLYRYPPEGVPISALPDYRMNILLSMLQPGPPPCPVHSASTEVGDRWLIVSGHLLGELIGHISDEAVAAGLSHESPDGIAAWIEAAAARFPDQHRPGKFADWGLVVVDVVPSAPEPSGARGDRAPNHIDPEALLAQLHELEKSRS